MKLTTLRQSSLRPLPPAHSRANGNPVKHMIPYNNKEGLSTGLPLSWEWAGGISRPNDYRLWQCPKIRVRLVLTLILCFALAACGKAEAPLPVIKPEVEQGILDSIYGVQAGPSPVQERSLSLTLPDERRLPVRALYGSCSQTCPVLLFSHGFGSDNTEYDRLLEHWAGYDAVVLAPDHADSGGRLRAIFSSIRYGQYGLIQKRIEDLDHVLDRLDDIAETIDRRIDARRIIAAGHSFGAFSAQQLVGAGAYDPDSGRYDYPADPRVMAAVALSPPGPMFDHITEQSWTQVARPMLVTTGTRDRDDRFWPDWRLHKMSFETSLPGDKYALVVQGADHYLGNLICRTGREAEPQRHALMMVRAATTAFIAVQFAGSGSAAPERARAVLSPGYLRGITKEFAVMEVRR